MTIEREEIEAATEPAIEEANAPPDGGNGIMAAEIAPEAEPADEHASDSEAEAEAGAEAEPAPAPEPVPEPAPARSVGRFIADALRAVGVRYAFTVPGESFLGLIEGLDAAGIRIVATRHESAAAFMAEAHGQLTGRPAIAMGTRAVGAANLAIGIHTARQDSSPMFVLVGQVERPFSGREAFQEVDQEATFGGLAIHAAEIRDARDVPAAIGDAIRAALTGRPGPSLLSLPEDLLDASRTRFARFSSSSPAPSGP
jgi:acetolactate synthase I/II/III large subunit